MCEYVCSGGAKYGRVGKYVGACRWEVATCLRQLL